jgi:hypothetical protein
MTQIKIERGHYFSGQVRPKLGSGKAQVTGLENKEWCATAPDFISLVIEKWAGLIRKIQVYWDVPGIDNPHLRKAPRKKLHEDNAPTEGINPADGT